MIRIVLDEKSREGLLRLRLGRKSNMGERAYYVLLAASGKSAPEIADYLGRNVITIRLWLRRYLEKGLEGLKSYAPPGRTAKKGPAIKTHLKELLSHSPQAYGYEESGWQINIFRDWLKTQGVNACENTIARALDELGYVYKRFSKTTPLNAPSATTKKAKVGEIVQEIQQQPLNGIEILFADESHFSNQPYINRGWFKRGEKKRLIP